MDLDEMRAHTRAEILALFDVTEEEDLIAFDPSYHAARVEADAAEERFRAALPGRMQEIADQLSVGLPDGYRLEYVRGGGPTDGR